MLLDEGQIGRAMPPIKIDNNYNVTEELGLMALPMLYQSVPVHQVEAKTDHVLQGYLPSVCPRIA